MRVLLLSTYELGHQPLGLARPAADLMAAGHEVRCQDLAVDHLDEALVALGRPGRHLGADAHGDPPWGTPRRARPGAEPGRAPDVLRPVRLAARRRAGGRLGDSAIGGEYEGPLVALADALDAVGGKSEVLGPVPGVRTGDTTTAASSSGASRSGCRAATCCRRWIGTRRSISGRTRSSPATSRRAEGAPIAACTARSRRSTAAGCGSWSATSCWRTSSSWCGSAPSTSRSATRTSSTASATRCGSSRSCTRRSRA